MYEVAKWMGVTRSALEPGRGGDMGRGRQKAKDAKIARQIKYSGPHTDLQALERELVSGGTGYAITDSDDDDQDDTYRDRWADEE